MCKVKQKCDKTRESMVLKNIWIFAPKKKKGKRKLIINFGAKFKCFVRCAIKWDFFWWFSYHCVVLYRNTTMRKSHQKTNDNDNIYYRSKAYLSPIRKKKLNSVSDCLHVCTWHEYYFITVHEYNLWYLHVIQYFAADNTHRPRIWKKFGHLKRELISIQNHDNFGDLAKSYFEWKTNKDQKEISRG